MNSKRVKKEGGANYYNKYAIKRGGKGACIDLINLEKIKFGC